MVVAAYYLDGLRRPRWPATLCSPHTTATNLPSLPLPTHYVDAPPSFHPPPQLLCLARGTCRCVCGFATALAQTLPGCPARVAVVARAAAAAAVLCCAGGHVGTPDLR